MLPWLPWDLGRDAWREERHKGKVRTYLPDLHVHAFIFNLQIKYLHLKLHCLKGTYSTPFGHSYKLFMTGCTLCRLPRIKAATVNSFLLSVPLGLNSHFWWNTLSARHSQAADWENGASSEIGLESTSVLCFSHGICQTWKNIGQKPSLLESYFLQVVKNVIYFISALYIVKKFTFSITFSDG